MATERVSIRVVIANRKAFKALAYAAGVLADIGEAQPWNTEARKAAKALLYAARNLKPETHE